MYYVYIIKSLSDNSRYIGMTSDLKNRIEEHNNKESMFTKSKAPYKLAWHCAFPSKKKALDFETYLKSSSGYAFTNKRLIVKD